MFRIASKALSAVAVATLLLAQPAMATRSAGSLPATSAKATPVEGQRSGSDLREAEELRGGFLIPAIAIVAIILGILAATSGSKSPG